MATTNTIRARLLYKFLVKNRALHAYVEELIKQKSFHTIVKDYKENKDLMSLLSRYNNINDSLHWVQTSQGFDFWRDLFLAYLKFEENFLNHEYQS